MGTRTLIGGLVAAAAVVAGGAVVANETLLSAAGATYHVSPTGSDSASCSQSAPCATLNRVWLLAAPGDSVRAEPGTYPSQLLTYDADKDGASERVTFDLLGASFPAVELRGVQHALFNDLVTTNGSLTVRLSTANQLIPSAKPSADVEFVDPNIKTTLIRNVQGMVVRGTTPVAFDGAGAKCRIGGFDVAQGFGVPKVGAYPPESGGTYTPSRDIAFDQCFFHDVIRTSSASSHAECFFHEGGERVAIRRSVFTNCAVFDIFVEPRGGLVKDFVVENVMLDTPRGLAGEAAGSAISLKGPCCFAGVAIRWSSILGGVRTDSGSTDWSTVSNLSFHGNRWRNTSCNTWPAAAFTGNVQRVSCGGSGNTVAADVGFVSESLATCNLASCFRNDLHARSDAPALNAGPSDAPTVDIDGQSRPQGAGPEAGADEWDEGDTTTTDTTTDTETTTEPPPACPTDGALELRVIAQDATTITLGWDAVAGATGYRFSRSDQTKRPHTWDGSRTSVKFGKGAECYGVEALSVSEQGGHRS